MPEDVYVLKMLTLANDRCPFEDWYRNLRQPEARARIRARLARMRAGNFGDCKPVGGGVSELRIDVGPGYRIYYAVHEQSIVVLIVGGDKSSQSDDIDVAKALWE